jgi:methylmalonyl-CoA mutase
MSAVMGGTQSLHTNALDEALALPTDHSAAIARDTQFFLQEDADITSIIDPYGGSLFLESLTQELITKAKTHIEEIEEMGGMAAAIEAGIPKMRIEEAAARRQARIDSGKDRLVGVNIFNVDDRSSLSLLQIDNTAVTESQLKRLHHVKQSRDPLKLKEALEEITAIAITSKGNLLAAAIEAARHRATLGEISDAMEKVFGRYTASPMLISGVYGKEINMEESFQSARKAAVSSLAAGHAILVPDTINALRELGREDIAVVVGGIIPEQDHDQLKNDGALAIFGPGTVIPAAALELLQILSEKLGYDK